MWDSILNGCAALLYQLAQLVGDWGLAICIVTVIIRLLLFPVQQKQLKSTFGMQELQPKIKALQEKYADDQQRLSEEMMKLYQEVGFNPLAGCLPMLIQMPIFIILFQTLRFKLADYQIEGQLAVSFYNILPDLTLTVPDSGFGLWYCVFGILFIVLSVGPMGYQLIKQNTNQNNESMTWMMLIFFGLMFIYMAWISPAGVILYWALSSGLGFVQQLVTNRVLKKKREEEIAELNLPEKIEVDVERKVKKKRPHKKH